jgi:hypothetical protein
LAFICHLLIKRSINEGRCAIISFRIVKIAGKFKEGPKCDWAWTVLEGPETNPKIEGRFAIVLVAGHLPGRS